jgi:hypothetical protein
MKLRDRSQELWRRFHRATLGAFTVAVAVICFGTGSPVYGLIITPTFGSSITSDPNSAAIMSTINSAINDYQTRFSDPITVTIQFNEMTSGLGNSTTGFYNIPYQTFITALHNDATTADDATALALLPITATNPVNGNSSINVTSANLRALGLPGAGIVNGTFDGAIGLNTHITDVGSPGTTGQFSLRATTQHEIDEVLGFRSALPNGSFGTIFPVDLFRYNNSGGRSFTISSSAQAFFSIDSTTLLAQFDNQNDGGDFGDWQSNPLPSGVSPKVQDAFATPGAQPTLGVELRALDVIGYDLVAVPEPATLTLLAVGTLALSGHGWLRRGRRSPRETESSRVVAS